MRLEASGLPIYSIVVPFCGSYLGSYKVIPKRNYYGACGQLLTGFRALGFWI